MQIEDSLHAVPDQGEGLMLSGEIPVAIFQETAAPDEYRLAGVNRKNEILLKAGLLLNEHNDIEEHHELSHYLLKQDVKLNLILELIGDLVRSQEDFPVLRNICVTPSGLTLYDGLEGIGSAGPVNLARFHLHMLAELPKALVFYGTLVSSEEDQSRYEFIGMNQHVTDLLEKVLFRHHRRKIAMQNMQGR